MQSYDVVARVTRGGLDESLHHGCLIALDPTGAELFRQGDPSSVIYARSSLKPLQAVAMVRSGLTLTPELLALACASHSGEEMHLAGVRRILASVDLAQDALSNTPDYPYDVAAAAAWRVAGHPRSRLAQNCSGKHAAMIATCVINGWATGTYLDPSHPLQRAIRETIVELTGDQPAHVSIDGCGAPLFSCSVVGLARAFGDIASSTDSAKRLVAAAMSQFPQMVGGTGREATRLMAGAPGVIAKDGAEGVFAAGLPDGSSVALKILDGSDRARPVVMSAALTTMGLRAGVLREFADAPVLGHGHPVGSIVATLGSVR